MLLISHRGNTVGKNQKRENHPEYIDLALKDFNCEIDLWYHNDSLFLGHDFPQYKIDDSWIVARQDYLWIHCKNTGALNYCSRYPNINYFWHDKDDYTLTRKGFVWAYPGRVPTLERCISVLPESVYSIESVIEISKSTVYGICSDFIMFCKNN